MNKRILKICEEVHKKGVKIMFNLCLSAYYTIVCLLLIGIILLFEFFLDAMAPVVPCRVLFYENEVTYGIYDKSPYSFNANKIQEIVQVYKNTPPENPDQFAHRNFTHSDYQAKIENIDIYVTVSRFPFIKRRILVPRINDDENKETSPIAQKVMYFRNFYSDNPVMVAIPKKIEF